MAGIFTKAKKQKLPPVQKVAPPPEITEEAGDEAARRLRSRAKGGFAGTLRVGELGGRESLLGGGTRRR